MQRLPSRQFPSLALPLVNFFVPAIGLMNVITLTAILLPLACAASAVRCASGSLSTAAMAYQAPQAQPSMPSSAPSSVPMMRSNNVTDLPSKPSLTAEELERMVAPIVGLDLDACRITYSPQTGEGVRFFGGRETAKQRQLVIKKSDEACYKALKKFNRKGVDIEKTIEKCCPAKQEGAGKSIVVADVWKFIKVIQFNALGPKIVCVFFSVFFVWCGSKVARLCCCASLTPLFPNFRP